MVWMNMPACKSVGMNMSMINFSIVNMKVNVRRLDDGMRGFVRIIPIPPRAMPQNAADNQDNQNAADKYSHSFDSTKIPEVYPQTLRPIEALNQPWVNAADHSRCSSTVFAWLADTRSKQANLTLSWPPFQTLRYQVEPH